MVSSGAVGDAIAAGLRRHGLGVAIVAAIDGYDAAFARAESAIGQLDAVVWAQTPAPLGHPAPITSVDEAGWVAAVGDPLRSYVEFLQAAERKLRGLGGRVVVVVPTIATSGAANLVPWSTVAEGQRALAKSVARTWGAEGVIVNCVAVPAALLVETPEVAERPNLQRSALDEPTLEHAVAAVIAMLCSVSVDGVTGATIGVDGGQWMPS